MITEMSGNELMLEVITSLLPSTFRSKALHSPHQFLSRGVHTTHILIKAEMKVWLGNWVCADLNTTRTLIIDYEQVLNLVMLSFIEETWGFI
jgi:hypothetical protein